VELRRIMNCYENKNIGIIGEEEMNKFSVTIPLVFVDNKINVLFEVRAKHLRTQPGEISFPGGKIEIGESRKDAAIRETCEELGIREEDMEIIGKEDLLITQHNRIIYPYVGILKNHDKVVLSKSEVDHIFLVPLDFFLENEPIVKPVKVVSVPPEDFPYELIEDGENYKWRVGMNNIYLYKYEKYTIWGLTARILYQFIKTIKESEMERK
jgi:peroxisomal coenzyme A diphosphatase NUDT7